MQLFSVIVALLTYCLVTKADNGASCHTYTTPNQNPFTSNCTTTSGYQSTDGCMYAFIFTNATIQPGSLQGNCGRNICNGTEFCEFVTKSGSSWSYTMERCCCNGDLCNTINQTQALYNAYYGI